MQSPLPQSLDSQIPGHDGQFTVSLSFVTTQGFARRLRILPDLRNSYINVNRAAIPKFIVFRSVIVTNPNGNNFGSDIASSSTFGRP